MLEGSGGGAPSKIFLFCAIMQLAGSNKKQRPWFEYGNSMQLHSSDTCIYNHLLADIYIFFGGGDYDNTGGGWRLICKKLRNAPNIRNGRFNSKLQFRAYIKQVKVKKIGCFSARPPTRKVQARAAPPNAKIGCFWHNLALIRGHFLASSILLLPFPQSSKMALNEWFSGHS